MNCWFSFFIIFIGFCVSSPAQSSKTLLFTGNYTGGQPGKGLYVYEFNYATSQLRELSHIENITNPSFIDISPDGKFLYACTDAKLLKEGSVSAYKIDSVNATLTFINKQKSGGENPVYLSVHKYSDFVANANYNAGSVSVFKTNADGSLNPYKQFIPYKESSINKERQETSHIHSAVFSPDGNYLYLPDLGADKIRSYRFDTTSVLPLILKSYAETKTVAGSGPRHLTFHPTLKFAYCIEEISGMVSLYGVNNGHLDPVQREFSSSKEYALASAADIHISPDGLFLYASNRGDDNTLSIFYIIRPMARSPFGDIRRQAAIIREIL